MKKYKDPMAELIEIDASILTLNDSGELDDFGKGSGDTIDDLINGN